MTNHDNRKIYGVCVIVWVPLNQAASDGLERQCEEWRRINMSDEEREMARSLGERLSLERAKLSRLLADLPRTAFGSTERDELEEESTSFRTCPAGISNDHINLLGILHSLVSGFSLSI